MSVILCRTLKTSLPFFFEQTHHRLTAARTIVRIQTLQGHTLLMSIIGYTPCGLCYFRMLGALGPPGTMWAVDTAHLWRFSVVGYACGALEVEAQRSTFHSITFLVLIKS